MFITHGHSYYVSMETEQIREEGAARNADIIMFGHTHRPYFEERDGITVLNPGSLSFPRQEGRKSSYMILETDGEEKYELCQQFLVKNRKTKKCWRKCGYIFCLHVDIL